MCNGGMDSTDTLIKSVIFAQRGFSKYTVYYAGKLKKGSSCTVPNRRRCWHKKQN
jgi:hypothetical protein